MVSSPPVSLKQLHIQELETTGGTSFSKGAAERTRMTDSGLIKFFQNICLGLDEVVCLGDGV